MEDVKLPNFWTKEEDAIIIDSINKKHTVGEGLAFALTRMTNTARTLGTVTTRFYDESRRGSYDGKINNSKFKKLREKQKLTIERKKALKTSIKVKPDDLLITDKNPEKEEPKNIHLEVKGEEALSFIVQGTTSLGGIPLRAKFRITGDFTIDILPLDE